MVNSSPSATEDFVYSTDEGVTWAEAGPETSDRYEDIHFADGNFVAVGLSGDIKYSTDGINWTSASGAGGGLHGVEYGNGLWVAVAVDGANRVSTSTDAITWTQRSAAEQNAWESVAYGNGIWVAVSSDGTNRIMTSTDGINWTARTVAIANSRSWRDVQYVKDRFLALGSCCLLYTSPSPRDRG